MIHRQSFLTIMTLLTIFGSATGWAQTNTASNASKQVMLIEIKEAITPVTEKYIVRAFDEAKARKLDAVLIALDTPGGLLESTRDIVQTLLSADEKGIDSIVYVSPSGARAGSAGVFITLAAKYAAMAPGCNIGAAHPVSIGEGGNETGSNALHLMKKIENDTTAFIRSICQQRDRNETWAVKAVIESVSITADEALTNKVIDYIAPTKEDLLGMIYGKNTKIDISTLEKTWGEWLLTVLANPNLSYMLILLGVVGIFFEIRSPGMIFPGVIGAIAIVLGLFSSQVLPLNFAGVALIVIAFVLFFLEFQIVSWGLLTVGGIISLVLGAAMLFDTPLPFMRVSVSVIVVTVVCVAILVALMFFLLIPSVKMRVVSGKEGMTDEIGVAAVDFENGKGSVRVHGEIWSARSDEAIFKDDEVMVERSAGLKVFVKRIKHG